MFFVKIRVSARLPGASVLYGGGVPDAPGTLLQPHTSRRHEGMPPYIPPYKQTVGRGALTPPRRNHAYRGKRCNLFVGDDACIIPRNV